MSQRLARLEELLVRELANLLQHQVRDPRLRNVGVTRVELSADLRHLRVYVSVVNDEVDRQQLLRGLGRARVFLRRELAHRLDLRVTPELHFQVDRGPEHSQRIHALLAELAGSRPSDSEAKGDR